MSDREVGSVVFPADGGRPFVVTIQGTSYLPASCQDCGHIVYVGSPEIDANGVEVFRYTGPIRCSTCGRRRYGLPSY